MVNTLYLPELREMLAEDDVAGLREFCVALHPARTAEFMEGLTAAEAWGVLRQAEASVREEVFTFLDPDKQIEIIETQDRREIAVLVADLAADDRVDLLEDVDEQVVQELLPLMPDDERRDTLRLRAHPERTAGALMTTEVAKLSEHLTVSQALKELSTQSERLETIYYIYVVDDRDHLRGVVSTRQLVSAIGRPDTLLGDLMETNIETCLVTDDQEQVARKVAHYDLLAIPVVDSNRRMLGIITHDDVIDVLREEATEDAHRIGAVAPLEAGYMRTNLLTLSWKRGVWLTILFFGALLTAFALQRYQDDLSGVWWLVLFIPLVISSGGNTGNQSATLVITALALGEISTLDWGRVVRRELVMGLMLGSFLGLLGFACALFFIPYQHAVVIPITLVLVVIAGTLTGAILPLLFHKLGWDPALMSNPFVAGLVDIMGIVIYMNVARLVL